MLSSVARTAVPTAVSRTKYVFIWDFQYDRYLLISCPFGLLAYHWVPSPWLAFLMVDGELSRTS